jgi:iron complex outermembrane recepter protein
MKAKFAFQLPALILVQGLFNSAHAQSTNLPPPNFEATNEPIILPPVTVIGTNGFGSLTSPSLSQAEEKKKQVPGGFTIQGVAPMHQGRVSSMDDLLQGAPGVVMLSENEVEVSKVFIRGSGVYDEDEPIGVQYLIDGLTLNQGDGEIILEDFDVGTFKYSEIYRGANALQYGALGLGGAVNFVPFTGYDAPPASVRLEAGSFGFFRGQVSSGGVYGPWDFYLSFSDRSRDGYREHSRENTQFLFSDFGYKFSDTLENRFYIIADQTHRQLPGALSLEQLQQDPQQDQTNAVAQNWRKDWTYLRLADKLAYESGGESASLGVYYWHRNAYEPNLYIPDNEQQDTGYNQGIGAFYADDFGGLFNSTYTGELFGRDNIFTIGLNPTAENEVDSYYANLNGQPGQATGNDTEWSLNTVFFAQNQHYLTDKLSLITAVQAAYVERNFYDNFNNGLTATNDLNQSGKLAFRAINPKIGLLYELTDKDQVYANFSRSWQPPSFDDMVDFDSGYNTSQTFTPLESQKAWTAEVGARGEDGRFEWELSLYRSWVRDELLDEYNSQTDVEIGGVNIPKTINQGIEAGLEVRLLDSVFLKNDAAHFSDHLTLRQNFTLSDLRFDNDPTFGNNQIAGVPEYDYEGQLLYEAPCGFYAGPNVHWVIASFPVDNSNTLYAPSYALLGFKTGMQIGKHVSIFFEAKNLLDERYASSVDPISDNQANGGVPGQTAQVFHPGDPRSFYFGVSWEW